MYVYCNFTQYFLGFPHPAIAIQATSGEMKETAGWHITPGCEKLLTNWLLLVPGCQTLQKQIRIGLFGEY